MSGEQLSFLHMAAILSWYYRCPEARAESERAEAERKERVKRFRLALVHIFGGKYDFRITTNGGCIETEIEGLRLLAYEGTSSQQTEAMMMVSLLGRCPSCGVETMSETFTDLGGLGKQLEKFEPISRHLCGSWR